MSEPEKKHIIDAFSFELGKVKSESVRQQVVDMFANVSVEMAATVADAIGVVPPQGQKSSITKSSPALSQLNTVKKPDTRKVGVILGNDFNGSDIMNVLHELTETGIEVEVISEKFGKLRSSDGEEITVDQTFLTCDPVLFDGLYIGDGYGASPKFKQDAAYFVQEAFVHYKPIGATHEGKKFIQQHMIGSPGVVTDDDINLFTKKFISAISAHRHWDRKVI